ncbi:8943_t:CDS:1, partial [Rhizophagus irregularis]
WNSSYLAWDRLIFLQYAVLQLGYGRVQVQDFRTESLNSVLVRPSPNFGT